MEEKGEGSGLREAKPGKAPLTDGMWLRRAWGRAVAEKPGRSGWLGFTGRRGLLDVDTEKGISLELPKS